MKDRILTDGVEREMAIFCRETTSRGAEVEELSCAGGTASCCLVSRVVKKWVRLK